MHEGNSSSIEIAWGKWNITVTKWNTSAANWNSTGKSASRAVFWPHP